MLPYELDYRPNSEFGYDAAVRKLSQLPLATTTTSLMVPGEETQNDTSSDAEPGFSNHQGNLLQLSTQLDLESRMSIGCAGAVLAYLNRRRALLYLPGDTQAQEALPVSMVETVALHGHM